MSDRKGLNLGCGQDIDPDLINVDIVPLPGVDVVADLDQKWPWDDSTVPAIKASHIFEHVADPLLFMAEAWRVLEDGGVLDVRVPYYRHIFAFTDPTHRRFCTELTFDYWIPGTDLHAAYGAGFGSPPVRFEMRELALCGREREELRAVLVKVAGDG